MLRKPLPMGVAVGPLSAQPHASIASSVPGGDQLAALGGVLGTGSKLLPFNAGVQCGGYLADALGNFTANAVARNQNCFHK